MEQDGVGDTEVDVNYLSDGQLAQRLRQLGANIGPVTGTSYLHALAVFRFDVVMQLLA